MKKINDLTKLFFPVLDKGFISLVDVMGSDEDIEQAARISYQSGTRKKSETRGLLRYLMSARHTSPFEQAELKFHVCAPIFVINQWFRHRTACLTGDVEIWIDEPAAIAGKKRKRQNRSIEDFYNKWHNGSAPIKRRDIRRQPAKFVDSEKIYSVQELATLFKINNCVYSAPDGIRTEIRNGNVKTISQQPYKILGQDWINFALKEYAEIVMPLKNRLKNLNIRSCNEETGEIIHTNITDIWQNGIKPVFQIILENGYSIKMTKEHLCLTENGWLTLEQATDVHLNKNDNVIWNASPPSFAVNGKPLYQTYEWLQQKRQEGLRITDIAAQAGCSYHTIRKYLKIFDLKFTAMEKVMLSSETQRGTKRGKRTKPYDNETRIAKIKEKVLCGSKSNFWRGGTSTERSLISQWTTQQSKKVFERYGFKCAICEDNYKLNAHHIDPVFNNLDKAYDFENLISLCQSCHQGIHQNNLELEFLNYFNNYYDLKEFFNVFKERQIRPINKRLQHIPKLHRTFSKIKEIKYVGEEMTYDISVSGPYHNFVANGFIVHNSVNSASGRYSIMPMMFYTPAEEQFKNQSKSNKQGRSEQIETEKYKVAVETWNHLRKQNAKFYEDMILEDVSREIARCDLPLSMYSQFYWKIDLHNLFHFLSLRAEEHAQYEIIEYAKIIGGMVKQLFPLSFEAWIDYQFCSTKFSRQEMEIINAMFSGGYNLVDGNANGKSFKEYGLSAREIKEFPDKLKPKTLPNFDLDLSSAKSYEYFEQIIKDHTPKIDSNPQGI